MIEISQYHDLKMNGKGLPVEEVLTGHETSLKTRLQIIRNEEPGTFRQKDGNRSMARQITGQFYS